MSACRHCSPVRESKEEGKNGDFISVFSFFFMHAFVTKFSGVMIRELIFPTAFKAWEHKESSDFLGYIHNLFIIFIYNNSVTYLIYL
jgi:hypothetical protein